ncbi:sterile alpha motif domain-containing protein 15-like [Morone saxatilis]|uniref:sterile alpha motif domain-containing protein 15-like n=1 Tax=Morone saxatilis TaxID=34816 RepID=UPI0015E1C2AA|nr:sterile alpha motif domain-containing protein 15-like [Morone saxatilis]
MCEGNTYHLVAGNSFHGNMLTGNMEFLQWSCHDVARWIESLGFPQYRACFTENHITGRKLIYVNCVYLPRLGVTDFKDMQVISARVRELLGITETLWSRSIADPPRDSMSLFLEKKGRTGERADRLTFQQFLDSMRQ